MTIGAPASGPASGASSDAHLHGSAVAAGEHALLITGAAGAGKTTLALEMIALGAELIASQLEGEPWPLERELADAVDPARFLIRALRARRVGQAG